MKKGTAIESDVHVKCVWAKDGHMISFPVDKKPLPKVKRR